MKTIFNLKKSIFYVVVLAAIVSMASCSDDDETPTPLTEADAYGNYKGKLYVSQMMSRESAETDDSRDLDGKIESGKISFEDFPVIDILAAIEGEDAEAILETMEAVKYETVYTSKLNAAKDSIYFTLDDVPLEFTYEKNVSEEDEEENIEEYAVKVTLNASENGSSYSSGKVKLNLIAEKIEVNEVILEPYAGQSFVIKLNKQ